MKYHKIQLMAGLLFLASAFFNCTEGIYAGLVNKAKGEPKKHDYFKDYLLYQMLTGPGTFTPTGNMSVARSGHTATLLGDGKVLITGGYSENYISSAEIYNPDTGSFTSISGSMKGGARSYHSASALANGKVLIAGGQSGGNTWTSAAELYDPVTSTFSATGNIYAGVEGLTTTLLNNGNVLITGGSNGYLNTFVNYSTGQLYNPATNTYSATGSMLTTKTNHTATLLNNGKVLITGGINSYSSACLCYNAIPNAELYDPVTGLFSNTGTMNVPRASHSATLLGDGKVLITGGFSGGSFDNISIGISEIYDPVSGIFTLAANRIQSSYSHTSTLLANNKVLITGGITGNYVYSSTAELFDSTAGVFKKTGTFGGMLSPRYDHRATLLKNGKVLITGGGTGAAYTSSCELYNP